MLVFTTYKLRDNCEKISFYPSVVICKIEKISLSLQAYTVPQELLALSVMGQGHQGVGSLPGCRQ